MTSKNSKDHEASEQFVTTSTIGKSFIESGDRTAALPDEIKREYFETFDRLLAKFGRRFTDNLPVLSTFEALDPSSKKLMDSVTQAFLCYLRRAGHRQHSSPISSWYRQAFLAQ